MTITLKPELEKVAVDDIEAGRAADMNDFLNRAVYHYALARDLGETYAPEELDEMIDAGLHDIEHGDLVSGDEAFLHLRAQIAQRRQQSA